MRVPPLPAFALLSSLLLGGCASSPAGLTEDGRALSTLIVERLDWMDEVADVKRARSLPVNDPVREVALLTAMEHRGLKAGLSSTTVRGFFLGQIAAACEVQQERLRQPPSQRQLPDLVKTVRPALDEIGSRMIVCLSRVRGIQSDAAIIAETRRKLKRAGYSEAVILHALDGLQDGLEQ